MDPVQVVDGLEAADNYEAARAILSRARHMRGLGLAYFGRILARLNEDPKSHTDPLNPDYEGELGRLINHVRLARGIGLR